MAGVAPVEFKGAVGNRLPAPGIVGGFEYLRPAGVGELHYAAKVVGVGVVDCVRLPRLPRLLYVHRRQAVGAVQVVELARYAALGYLFVAAGIDGGLCYGIVLFELGFPALLVGKW